jgi:hypothetical protein
MKANIVNMQNKKAISSRDRTYDLICLGQRAKLVCTVNNCVSRSILCSHDFGQSINYGHRAYKPGVKRTSPYFIGDS